MVHSSQGASGEKAIYTFEAEVPSEPIAALRLEALTHESLKANGPGRNTTNGNPNFVLTELTVSLRDKEVKNTQFRSQMPKQVFRKATSLYQA